MTRPAKLSFVSIVLLVTSLLFSSCGSDSDTVVTYCWDSQQQTIRWDDRDIQNVPIIWVETDKGLAAFLKEKGFLIGYGFTDKHVEADTVVRQAAVIRFLKEDWMTETEVVRNLHGDRTEPPFFFVKTKE